MRSSVRQALLSEVDAGKVDMQSALSTIHRRRHSLVPGCALLLVLAFFLHDLCMADGTHAPTLDVSLTQAHHAAASLSTTGGTCWVVRPMLSGAGEARARLVAIGPLFFSAAAMVAAPLLTAAWVEPTWPPGRRRALVQVYRL
jgi:hypothetical protein